MFPRLPMPGVRGYEVFVLRIYLSQWQTRVAIFVAGAVVFFSTVSALVNGVETVRDVFGWAIWVYERANTPWLGVFVLILIGGMLWWGIREGHKAMERGSDIAKSRDEAAMEAIKALRTELASEFEVPQLIAKITVLQKEYDKLQPAVEKAQDEVRKRGDRVRAFSESFDPNALTADDDMRSFRRTNANMAQSVQLARELAGVQEPLDFRTLTGDQFEQAEKHVLYCQDALKPAAERAEKLRFQLAGLRNKL